MSHFNGVKNGDKVVVQLGATHMNIDYMGATVTGEIEGIILSGAGDPDEYNSAYLRVENSLGICRNFLIEAGPGAETLWKILSIKVAE